MGKMLFNDKTPKCAFCRQWYDPVNAVIEPAVGKGMWYITDSAAKNKCLIKGIPMIALATCNQFESKL